MTLHRSQGPYAKQKQKHRPAPNGDGPPPNLKLMSNSDRGKYYRHRRKLYGAHLEEEVAELREEIAALTVSHQVQQELAVSQRCTPLGAAAHIVHEYCLLFSHGTPVRLTVNENDVSASLVAQATNAQRGFLNAVMTDGVRFGEFIGVELLLDQWERYSLYHAAISWTMKSLDIVQLNEGNQNEDGPLLISITADLRVRYSRRTIEEVFPHLIGDEELIQSLIGLEVTYPSINHFHFNKDGKIEWYAPEADFVGALMNVFKDPVLVARVMGHALIAKGHMIGDESDGRKLAIDVVKEAHTTEVRGPTLVEDFDSKFENIPSEHDYPSCSLNDEIAVIEDDPADSLDFQSGRMKIAYILDE
ncbi:hypothetical protein PHMEG_00027679 [Phytophthora megakarya]|uniref:Uncharacterized protein n=1 Tax=Phytophthora megakarya TaxID=4795 RepID=A0A225V6U0_9STRA|nr:hypothetical protein PHMEG_00027679 [Phytophthora megakarya]